MSALSFLRSLDATSVVLLFWYTILFEIPRYLIGAVIVHGARLWRRARPPIRSDLTLSVVLAGHNEATALPACVASLAEQTTAAKYRTMEVIIVDDGSTDQMFEVAKSLQREGMVDEVLRLDHRGGKRAAVNLGLAKREGTVDEVLQLDHRGGKSAAVNLGLAICTGDIVVIADADTTFDRDAFAELLSYFADPRVGAVSGNLGVRNSSASLIARHQAIEYAISISLGRSIQDVLGILSIASGAFGAFRRAAIEGVGGQDVEVGEDAELTMKLRRAGWRIRFAPDARALTDAPETVSALIAQRLRWDRGLVTIWMRKFRSILDPRQSTFRLIDVMALVDVIFFQVLLALVFPVYIVWLHHYYGELFGIVIEATLIGLVGFNLLLFAAAMAMGIHCQFQLIFYLPLYTIVQVSLMRVVRIIAIAQEFIFSSSYRDPYVPARVMSQVEIV